MSKFNIAQTKGRAHFSELVQRAMLLEEVIIAKNNTPFAKLVPLSPPRGLVPGVCIILAESQRL